MHRGPGRRGSSGFTAAGSVARIGWRRDHSRMGEATIQAHPSHGPVLPAHARGARPVFFDDDGATDAVLAIVTALATEVWALRERLSSLEAVLAKAGVVDQSAVEAYQPDEVEAASRAEEASAFTGRVFRVFEEMREEALAGESHEQYLAVVQRAFDEL